MKKSRIKLGDTITGTLVFKTGNITITHIIEKFDLDMRNQKQPKNTRSIKIIDFNQQHYEKNTQRTCEKLV